MALQKISPTPPYFLDTTGGTNLAEGGGGANFLERRQQLPQKTFLTCFSVWLFLFRVLHFVASTSERD